MNKPRLTQAALLTATLACIMLSGCANSPAKAPRGFEEMQLPTHTPENHEPSGGLYQAGTSLTLFEDFRARRVGDIVTVLLVEQTDAEKSSGTSVGKSNSNEITDPILAGRARTIGHNSNLGFSLGSEHDFNGESDSNQSNKLQGNITVTVKSVLPNGNLVIQGEKWIGINQGNEYIRLQGVVRPVDIGRDNNVLSTKIADARISYGGTGATADANVMGWLSRFFISQLWPF